MVLVVDQDLTTLSPVRKKIKQAAPLHHNWLMVEGRREHMGVQRWGSACNAVRLFIIPHRVKGRYMERV